MSLLVDRSLGRLTVVAWLPDNSQTDGCTDCNDCGTDQTSLTWSVMIISPIMCSIRVRPLLSELQLRQL